MQHFDRRDEKTLGDPRSKWLWLGLSGGSGSAAGSRVGGVLQ